MGTARPGFSDHPRAKLSSSDAPHRPLLDRGRAVEISFEAVWLAESPLGADLARLADGLATKLSVISGRYAVIHRDRLPDADQRA